MDITQVVNIMLNLEKGLFNFHVLVESPDWIITVEY